MGKTIEVTLPTLQPRQPFNWYKYIILACIITVGVVIFQLIPKCSTDVIEPLDDSIKDTIAAQKLRRDSIHEVAVKAVETVTVYVTKWRTLKWRVDSIPCPEALAEVITLTDSIVKVDSTAIAELKAELFVADLIIANYDTLVKKDSVRIASLNRKVRKLKRQRNIAAGVGALGWIFAAVK